MMLTGDSAAMAKRVAADLGLDDYFAEVLPHQKAEKIREVKARGLTVAMVGDGVNDAPALTVGVLLTPAFGAALMSLSTVIVAINAKLLQRTGRRRVRSDPDAADADFAGAHS